MAAWARARDNRRQHLRGGRARTYLRDTRHTAHLAPGVQRAAVRPGAAPARAQTRPETEQSPRQPKLADRLLDPTTTWQTCSVPWNGQHTATPQLITRDRAVAHRRLGPATVRWVLVRSAPSRRSPVALFCTDPSVSAEQTVSWHVDRRQIEATFQEVRAQLGLRLSASGASVPSDRLRRACSVCPVW